MRRRIFAGSTAPAPVPFLSARACSAAAIRARNSKRYAVRSRGAKGRPSMAVRIKVCGITRCEDAELAVGLGADFIGLNFYPPSPRCLTIEPAAEIARIVKGRARLVGVFVNAARAYVKERLESLQLDLLQFHGDEDDDALQGWPVPVIRALRLRSDAALDAID